VRVKDSCALDAALAFSTPYLLLDAWSAAAYGGTGHVADWNLLSDFVRRNSARKFLLAGGLTPENVTEAIRAVRPAVVDVAGGVESEPRRKDAVLVKAFIKSAALGSQAAGDSP
jgi:phosphoribosylanthranilate isomerase